MSKKNVLIIGGILVALTLIFVFYLLPRMKQSPELLPNGTTPTPSISQSNDISIKNFQFSPATLTVKKGTTVTWTNNEFEAHTIDSTTFSSATMNQGDSFSFTFTTSGTFDYTCGLHPTMVGKVIVVD